MIKIIYKNELIKNKLCSKKTVLLLCSTKTSYLFGIAIIKKIFVFPDQKYAKAHPGVYEMFG